MMLLAAFFSCTTKPTVESVTVPITVQFRPFDLTATPGDQSARLQWKVNRRPDVPIHGYDIQLAFSPEGPWSPYLRIPYPGDTDGDIFKESIELQNLANGKRYFAKVITIIRDSLDSQSSEIVSFVPFQSGTLEISTDLNSPKAGYSFRKKVYLPAKDYANDLYFFFNERRKGIASPSLLHPSLRRTLIARGEPSSSGNGRAFELSQPFENGAEYTLKTADGATVRLRIKGSMRRDNIEHIVIYYEYHPENVDQ